MEALLSYGLVFMPFFVYLKRIHNAPILCFFLQNRFPETEQLK